MSIKTDTNIKEIHVREILQLFYPENYKQIDVDVYLRGNFVYLEYKGNIYKKEVEISLKNTIKRLVYEVISKMENKTFPYGILTGVKPINILKSYDKLSKDEIINHLNKYYHVSKEKAILLLDTKENQKGIFDEDAACIYIHIPFCPNRCSYCSFPSTITNDENAKVLKDYTACVIKEIQSAGKLIKEKNIKADCIYIGGGTPGILNEENLENMLSQVNKNFDTSVEFTFEMGRADTLRETKLDILKKYGVNRICLNPQSLCDETLKKYYRNISTKSFFESLKLIKKYDFTVNCDLIMGLNKEEIKSFKDEVNALIDKEVENITIHTLSLKRASSLNNISFENNDFYSSQRKCFEMLKNNGYAPYYLYKQKQSLCMGENVGFSLKGTQCIYNIKTMKDNTTIIALGSGAAGKVYNKTKSKNFRVDTTKDTNIYIKDIDNIIKRKEAQYSEYLK